MINDRDHRNKVEYWIDLFEGFVAEWQQYVYVEDGFRNLRKNMRIDVRRKAWKVEASVSYQPKFLGVGVRLFPRYIFSAGAILALHDLFMTLCSNPDFFPEVPGGQAEKLLQPHAMRYRDYTFLKSSPSQNLVHCMPEDDVRHALALYLMTAALHWLIYHEESHYLAGHLSFREQMHAKDNITEAELPVDEGELADIRALESHADERATLQVARTYSGEPGVYSHPVETFRIPFQGLRVALVAIGCVLLLFHASESGDGTKHPLPMTRLLDAYGVTYMALMQKEPTLFGQDTSWIDENGMQWLMNSTIADLQVAARLLGFEDSIAELIKPLFEPNAQSNNNVAELIDIHRHLKKIRPKLDECRTQLANHAWPGVDIDQW
jgi:hypothetical protein